MVERGESNDLWEGSRSNWRGNLDGEGDRNRGILGKGGEMGVGR